MWLQQMLQMFAKIFLIVLYLPFTVLLMLCILKPLALHLSTPVFTAADRVLLVVAHPDDECMFFSPVALSLAKLEVPVSVLCLSNGNYEGLGVLREKELVAACKVLQVPSKHVKCINHPHLQDGMEKQWPKDVVAWEVDEAVREYNITHIITFDGKGVSGHPNHISTYYGVRQYLQNQVAAGKAAEVTGWKLETVPVWRKYAAFFDLLFSFVLPYKNTAFFLSPDFLRGVRAMTKHRSQLVWFRYIYLAFSRYMYINTVQPIELS